MDGAGFAALRHGLSLTQDELAQRLDVTRQTVIRWERADKVPAKGEAAIRALAMSGEAAPIAAKPVSEPVAKPSKSRAVAVVPSRVELAKQALKVAEEGAAHLAKPAPRHVAVRLPDEVDEWGEAMKSVPLGPPDIPYGSRLKGQPSAPGRRR